MGLVGSPWVLLSHGRSGEAGRSTWREKCNVSTGDGPAPAPACLPLPLTGFTSSSQTSMNCISALKSTNQHLVKDPVDFNLPYNPGYRSWVKTKKCLASSFLLSPHHRRGKRQRKEERKENFVPDKDVGCMNGGGRVVIGRHQKEKVPLIPWRISEKGIK